MTAVNMRPKAGHAAVRGEAPLHIDARPALSQLPNGHATSHDGPRLVFIQLYGPEVAHILRAIDADGCDVAFAETADQAMGFLDGEVLQGLRCSLATWRAPAMNAVGTTSHPETRSQAQARTRRPLIVLLAPPCETAPEAAGAAMMMSEGSGTAASHDFAAAIPLETTRPTLVYGDIEIDLMTFRAFRNKQPLQLSLTGFRLLQALMERPGQVLTREHLVRRARGERHHFSPRLIDAHITRLRRALCAGGAPDVIRTVRGVGYAFSEVG